MKVFFDKLINTVSNNSLFFILIIVLMFILLLIIVFFVKSDRRIVTRTYVLEKEIEIKEEKTIFAKVVEKRTDNTFFQSYYSPSSVRSTKYYITFDTEDKKRVEIKINGNDYGMIVEGDYGKLTCKGDRFISFERE